MLLGFAAGLATASSAFKLVLRSPNDLGFLHIHRAAYQDLCYVNFSNSALSHSRHYVYMLSVRAFVVFVQLVTLCHLFS